MEMWCVKCMFMLKVFSSEMNLSFKFVFYIPIELQMLGVYIVRKLGETLKQLG